MNGSNTDLVVIWLCVIVVCIVDVRVVNFVTVETGIWRYEEQ